jgi:competence protein ComEC
MAGEIESLPVRFYMDNGDPHTTQTYGRLLAALDARPGITYLEATPRTISLGSASIEVLPLLPRGTTGLNDRSVALVVRFGNFKAFLSGDSEVRQLSHLVGQRAVPDVALLKAAHHGSDNGFTREFLRAAAPEVVVISVGRNSYGHPRPEALAAYASAGAAVLRTDLHGHVEIRGYGDGRYDVVPAQQIEAAAAPESAGRPAAQLRLRVHADAPGNDHDNLNGEYAVLESGGEKDVALGGWRLCDAAGHCFRFPPEAVLAAGGRIVVHTGSGEADGERYYMGYRRAVWNNGGDTATLYDRTGAAVVVMRY